VDYVGPDEVNFVTLLKGNWFLGILLSHKPFILDRCPVSGSLVGIPRWFPVDGFEVIFDLASWCFGTVLRNLTAYQMMRLRWGASRVPAKSAEQAFPLSNLGAQISHWTFSASQDLVSSIQTTDPPV
jgi:hypothetical protein